MRMFEHNFFNVLYAFLIFAILFLIFTLPQALPVFQFINLSARSLDVYQEWLKQGWFIPWNHLIQFLEPDFFGNTATLNYWGTWNYGEMVGYVGVLGLILTVLSLFGKKSKEILFFAGVIIAALIFATPNFIAQIPFSLSIPFLSTSQPTRLIFLIDFSLCILMSFGFNNMLKAKIHNNAIFVTLGIFVLVFAALWLTALGKINFNITTENLIVVKRNLIFPSIIFMLGASAILIYTLVEEELTRDFLTIAIIGICMFDLFRFGQKFTPFTNQSYFYPSTKVIEFLQKQKGIFRIAATDSRILAPNIATYYRLQSIEGYDPLYLKSYAELIASSERADYSITPPFGFNRIITPHNMKSPIINLLNVKYVLSFADLDTKQFKKVYEEGQTKVFENKDVLPRAFFVNKTITAMDDDPAVKIMFQNHLGNTAIVVEGLLTNNFINNFKVGSVSNIMYSASKVIYQTNNIGMGFLVLTDSFYPTWHATVDGNPTKIYRTDMNFRGIVVPAGNHIIEFTDSLFL